MKAHDTEKFVTDVSWCSSTGIKEDMIATSCESNLVLIWKPDPKNPLNLIPSKINVGNIKIISYSLFTNLCQLGKSIGVQLGSYWLSIVVKMMKLDFTKKMRL
jgi:hypothetical protein